MENQHVRIKIEFARDCLERRGVRHVPLLIGRHHDMAGGAPALRDAFAVAGIGGARRGRSARSIPATMQQARDDEACNSIFL
jgi:hypothetical protein